MVRTPKRLPPPVPARKRFHGDCACHGRRPEKQAGQRSPARVVAFRRDSEYLGQQPDSPRTEPHDTTALEWKSPDGICSHHGGSSSLILSHTPIGGSGMINRNSVAGTFTTFLLLFSYSAGTESTEINIKGTPTFNLESPIQVAPSSGATIWEYHFYPSQTGPEVAVQCESEAYRIVQAIRNAGEQRWELVNFINVGLDEYNDPCLIAVFKRPKK
jgi:hypothetical protein